MNELETYRQQIVEKVRNLRRERGWTQKKLAAILGFTQNRLSQIEHGNGSFSAEQLIVLARTFNLLLADFAPAATKGQPALQNALARLGAAHLRESGDTLPSEKMGNVVDAVCEVIVSAKSPRLITALTPILVEHAEAPPLNLIRHKTYEAGFVRRYGWLLENIRAAINDELTKTLSHEWKLKYKKADFVLEKFLQIPTFTLHDQGVEDILDPDISSSKTLDRVRSQLSDISKKWKVVTRLQPADFTAALRDSRETD